MLLDRDAQYLYVFLLCTQLLNAYIENSIIKGMWIVFREILVS